MEMLLPALVMGLLGSGHCLGMCGGVAAALTFAITSKVAKGWFILAYNLGRICSYGAMGLVFGWLWAQTPATGLPLARIAAGVVLILTGLYLANWWRVLGRLESLGGTLWRRIKPLGDHLLPVNTLPKAFTFGLVWGWLPCGLVYSALVLAATAANPVASASMMLAFGLGTMPAVMAGGFVAAGLKRFLQRPTVRITLALAYILFGLWTLYGAFAHSGHNHNHQDHQGHQQHEENSAPLPSPAADKPSEHHHHSP